jgi:hypothetical protein
MPSPTQYDEPEWEEDEPGQPQDAAPGSSAPDPTSSLPPGDPAEQLRAMMAKKREERDQAQAAAHEQHQRERLERRAAKHPPSQGPMAGHQWTMVAQQPLPCGALMHVATCSCGASGAWEVPGPQHNSQCRRGEHRDQLPLELRQPLDPLHVSLLAYHATEPLAAMPSTDHGWCLS